MYWPHIVSACSPTYKLHPIQLAQFEEGSWIAS